MAKYRIRIRASAVRELESLPQRERRRVVSGIRRLMTDRHPPGSEKLSVLDKYRLRVGFCRIAYGVNEKDLSVSVVKIGQRREFLDRQSFLRAGGREGA